MLDSAPDDIPETPTMEIALMKDFTMVPGQLFVLLSIIGPDCKGKFEKYALKVRGCFSTVAEAQQHAKRLHDECPYFDIFVADMYNWLVIPPDPFATSQVEYKNDNLNKIMKGCIDNIERGRKEFEKRKESLVKGEITPNDNVVVE